MLEAAFILIGVIIFIVLVLILWTVASYKPKSTGQPQDMDDPRLTYIRAEVYVEMFKDKEDERGEQK